MPTPAERYDQAVIEYHDADRKLDQYQGMLSRAALALEQERDTFHLTGLSHSGLGWPPEADGRGMDGRSFPDPLKIMQAISKRHIARQTAQAEWTRLSPDQRAEREQPPAEPNWS